MAMVLKTIRALTRPRGFESHALRPTSESHSDLGLYLLGPRRRVVTDRSQVQPTAVICRWSRDIRGMNLEAFALVKLRKMEECRRKPDSLHGRSVRQPALHRS